MAYKIITSTYFGLNLWVKKVKIGLIKQLDPEEAAVLPSQYLQAEFLSPPGEVASIVAR